MISIEESLSSEPMVLALSPLWVRPNVAVKLYSLPREEIDRLIKERLIKVAWWSNQADGLHPLIYAHSLDNYLDGLTDKDSRSTPVLLPVSPMWMRIPCAVKLSSLPRYEVDRLVKEKLIRVAWRPNESGTLRPLIYGPSLWAWMNQLAESGPAKEEEAK